MANEVPPSMRALIDARSANHDGTRLKIVDDQLVAFGEQIGRLDPTV